MHSDGGTPPPSDDTPPSDEQVLRLESARAGDAVLVSVAGEVDVLTVGRLRAAVQSAIDQPGPGPVVLDLTGVSFLASDGLGVLAFAQRNAAAQATALRIVTGGHRHVLVPLRLTGLDERLSLYPTVEAALLAGPPEPPPEVGRATRRG